MTGILWRDPRLVDRLAAYLHTRIGGGAIVQVPWHRVGHDRRERMRQLATEALQLADGTMATFPGDPGRTA